MLVAAEVKDNIWKEPGQHLVAQELQSQPQPGLQGLGQLLLPRTPCPGKAGAAPQCCQQLWGWDAAASLVLGGNQHLRAQ